MRTLGALALLAILGYLALLAALYFGQARLLYFPGPRDAPLPPPSAGLAVAPVRFATSDGVEIAAWVIRPPEPADSARWVLICHGNAGNISDPGRIEHYRLLHRLGVGVVAFDYRGYGESEGVPTEQGLYRDADAAYVLATERLGVPASRIVLFGHSLGSGVAVELASRRDAAGLIVEGAFTSVPERGQELYPYLPVAWIARHRFASAERIGRVTIPKLFLHAEADEVIPIAHGRRLYDVAPPPKEFVVLRGTHGDAFSVDSSRYRAALQRFLASLAALPSDTPPPRGS